MECTASHENNTEARNEFAVTPREEASWFVKTARNAIPLSDGAASTDPDGRI
jgi:hypothetical protein